MALTPGFDKFFELQNKLKGFSEATPMPERKFPNYLEAARKQAGVGKGFSIGQLPKSVLEGGGGNLNIGGGSAGGNKPGGMWGNARASSFWDDFQPTASGRQMRFQTIASPYLPLGTQLEVMYKGKRVKGIVEDLGPADWVMKQDPTRFLDLSEPMMKYLTGQRGNVAGVQYRVTKWGSGRSYRPSHPMTSKLRKMWGG